MSEFRTEEIAQVQNFMRQKFATDRIALMPRKKAEDSVEVLLGGEFLGTIYKDVEDGETSYNFTMAILDIDLE